jgi:hypothetical protein
MILLLLSLLSFNFVSPLVIMPMPIKAVVFDIDVSYHMLKNGIEIE